MPTLFQNGVSTNVTDNQLQDMGIETPILNGDTNTYSPDELNAMNLQDALNKSYDQNGALVDTPAIDSAAKAMGGTVTSDATTTKSWIEKATGISLVDIACVVMGVIIFTAGIFGFSKTQQVIKSIGKSAVKRSAIS
jgi:hypothetical protein